jgi:hypothetical protein
MHLSSTAISCSRRHRDWVLVRIAVDADLVPSLRHGLHFGRKCLDRVARDEPGRLDAKATEQPQQARTADLSGEQPARDVVGGVLSAVGSEPSGDRVDVDAKSAQDFFRHHPLPAWCA